MRSFFKELPNGARGPGLLLCLLALAVFLGGVGCRLSAMQDPRAESVIEEAAHHPEIQAFLWK